MTRSESGQSLTEYALLVATIAALAIGAALMVSQAVAQLFVEAAGVFK